MKSASAIRGLPGPAALALLSLKYYWGRTLLAIVGIAAASASITGALAIGESVTTGLRQLFLARIGNTTHIVAANHPVPIDLADRLCKIDGMLQAAPVLISNGAVRSEETGSAAPAVQLTGIDSRFCQLYPASLFPPKGIDCLINRKLAEILHLHVGSEITVKAAKSQSAPIDTLFAHVHVGDALTVLRLRVDRVLPDAGMGSFSLKSNASPQPAIFLSIEKLAILNGTEGMASAILVRTNTTVPQTVISGLRKIMTLQDCGLRLRKDRASNAISLEFNGLTLSGKVIEASRKISSGDGSGAASVLLSTRLSDVSTNKDIPYSVCAAGESPALTVKDGEITLNRSASDRLGARIGDKISLDVMQPKRDGRYSSLSFTLRLARILEMQGEAADADLTPVFQGISDARTIAEWDPPFPFDMRRITKADEAYWKRYRAAPRAFVPANVARAAWPASGGWITSYRFVPHQGQQLDVLSKHVERDLLTAMSPEDAGIGVRSIRRELLEAARGSSDFTGLFLGMGLFVVVAGVWLAIETVRAGIGDRAFESGLLLAAGWTPTQSARSLWLEQVFIAATGSFLGCVPGAIYAAGLLSDLDRRFQLGGVLRLEVRPTLWLAGMASCALLVIAALWLPCRTFCRRSTRDLLSGMAYSGKQKRAGRRELLVALVLACVAAYMIVAGIAADPIAGSRSIHFFCAGAFLLALGAPILSLILAALIRVRSILPGMGWLALRALAANRGNSRLLAGLAASSAFILAAVAGSVRTDSVATRADHLDGTGGFSLVATLTNPVALDFATPAGRKSLKFSEYEEAAFCEVRVFSLLRSSGDYAGCENIAHATAPILLGAGNDLVERGGFLIEPNSDIARGPWKALEWEPGRAVPAFGDADTVEWILHSSVGKHYRMPIDGRLTDLEFIGLMPGSIFSSELVISQDAFLRLGAGSRLPGYFLIDTPPGKEDAVAAALRVHLGEMGLDVRSTRSIISHAASIQNTYLSAFLALGAVAALLAFLAMAASGARRAVENRREYAILLALGFRSADVVKLPSLEMAVPAAAGVLWGSGCAIVALSPALVTRHNGPPVIAAAALPCVGMLAASMACSVLTARMARRPLVDALKAE